MSYKLCDLNNHMKFDFSNEINAILRFVKKR